MAFTAFDEIDLHVVAMLLLLAPLALLGGWWLAVPLAVPQGRIFVRAFQDYPAFKMRPWRYLVVNELFVIGAAAGLALAPGLVRG